MSQKPLYFRIFENAFFKKVIALAQIAGLISRRSVSPASQGLSLNTLLFARRLIKSATIKDIYRLAETLDHREQLQEAQGDLGDQAFRFNCTLWPAS